MESKEYIAAIDLGSSKIVGMIGWKRPDATLEVVAVEKIDSQTCIRRGNIHNLEETTNNVKQILQKLDARIQPNKLLKVYVGVSGQSIHTLNYQVSRTFANEEFICEKTIESIIDECYDYEVDENTEVLEVIPNEYKLDAKKTEINPVGVACEEIEANVRLLVGRSSLKRNISRAIEDKTSIDVCGMPIGQMASASLLLSDADKILGCALIDFGAGTTSVTIYKDGLLRHLAVIPFGGNVVTKDICSANLLEVDAEKLKTSFGSAIFNPEADNKVFKPRNLGTIDEPSIELHTLNNIIEARMTEIVHNVWAQIENSGFGKSLGAGIYYTGGASQLRNLGDLIKNITGIEAKKCATNRSIFNSSASSETMQNPAYSVVLGMLSSGLKNCVKVHQMPATESMLNFGVEEEPVVPEPIADRKHEERLKKEEERRKKEEEKERKREEKERKEREKKANGIRTKMGSIFGNLFSDSENDDDKEMK